MFSETNGGSCPALKPYDFTALRHTRVCKSHFNTVLTSHLGLQVACCIPRFPTRIFYLFLKDTTPATCYTHLILYDFMAIAIIICHNRAVHVELVMGKAEMGQFFLIILFPRQYNFTTNLYCHFIHMPSTTHNIYYR
jgi:hypothetical protein